MTVTTNDSPCSSCRDVLQSILHKRSLQVRFRPIADLRTASLFGHMAQIQGPADLLRGSFSRLAAVAHRHGLQEPLLLQSFALAISEYLHHEGSGLLLMTLPAGCYHGLGARAADLLWHCLAERNVDKNQLVVIYRAMAGLATDVSDSTVQLAARLHTLGIRTASDSFGCPLTEQKLWSRFPPDYLLLDDDIAASGEADAGTKPLAFLAAEQARGRDIIATRIGSASELRMLRALGIQLGSGDFFGRAHPRPARTLTASAYKAIAASGPAPVRNDGDCRSKILERLLVSVPAVDADTNAEAVFALFENDAALRAIPVVQEGKPLGVISRYDMVDNMARPYRHELFGRKPCTRFMDSRPLLVEVCLPLQDLTNVMIDADPRHLISGFVITSAGSYLGMGSVQELLREVTTLQMEAARYANPLTQLPGNVPTSQHIDDLLTRGEHCVIGYCDLDHFKPFNDVYGYARGDDVIRLTARVIGQVCDPDADFLGHIGGDDFIFIMRSTDWHTRCDQALTLFGDSIVNFFARDDIERGGYITENRKGQPEFHGLTSLSIGIIEVMPGTFQNHMEISTTAAEVKKKAKAIPGNSLYINQRRYLTGGVGPA